MPANINTALLIAAPMLQDYLVDKDGTPMAGGTITLYHDNSRTTLKNWYYQSGTPGNYTYVPLPNPLTLSGAGTICDINGVDTIPFFYPYDETDETKKDPYYITIVNHAQTNQITRANFPFLGNNRNNATSAGVNNLIVNNGFWRNIQPNYSNFPFTSVNLNTVTNLVVSPSQHDGFSMPDVQFFKSNKTANDNLTFMPFLASTTTVISNYVTPEYYINHQCTSAGTGENYKYYQFPIALHLQNLANQPFTFSIQAQNAGGTAAGQNVIDIRLLTFTGTGTSSPATVSIGTITLNPEWSSYTITDVFPDIVGLTLGNGQDDAFYLQIQMPLNLVCDINFTKPSIYLTSTTIPANEFQTYDYVNSIISSPRTGDIRISFNPFYNSTNKWCLGWLPMNNGTIGNASSNATTRQNPDVWQLYNMLWSFAQPYDTGSNFNAIAQIYSSAGAATNYGSTAIADFNANKQLALTQAMGNVLMGTVPISAIIGGSYTQGITFTNSGGKMVVNATNGTFFFVGQPITFVALTGSLPTGIVANAVYYVTNLNIPALTFNIATTYANALAGTPVVAYSAPSGTFEVRTNTTGVSIGEHAHTQLLNELVDHTHDPLSPGTGYINSIAAGGTANLSAPPGVISTLTTGSVTRTGSQTPFNITQSGTFYNMFIKL